MRKDKTKKIGISVLIGVIVGIVGFMSDLLSISDRLFPAEQSRITNAEINTSIALSLIYDDASLIQETDQLYVSENGQEINVLLSEHYKENSIDKYVIISQRISPEEICHLCAADVDGAIFNKVDDIWNLEVIENSFAKLGYFGIAPEAEVVEIGPEKKGFLFYFSGGSTGLAYTDAYLVAPFGEKFYKIFDERMKFDNFLGCLPDYPIECWGYSSDIKFVVGDNVSYYDILVKTRGTNQLDGGTIIPYDSEFLYNFSIGENSYKK